MSAGAPLPGETTVVLAGAYAGRTHSLSPWIIFIAAAAGAFIGFCISFWIGEKGGYPLARRYGPKVRLDERKLKVARYMFDRHGAKIVILGRFVSILRTYTAFLAGTSRMQWRRFLPANAVGAILWTGAYTLGAYLVGDSLLRVSGTLAPYLIGAAVLAVAALIILAQRHASKIAKRAEAAYPGPLE